MSHRKAALARADRILVMKEGRVEAAGTLDELASAERGAPASMEPGGIVRSSKKELQESRIKPDIFLKLIASKPRSAFFVC
ncbi:hypothetical protein LJK87_06375 [Paenibacillus sp. P25]|nr:hypothetical protein LJK87_06375 [Paenibacillus sp. P25]